MVPPDDALKGVFGMVPGQEGGLGLYEAITDLLQATPNIYALTVRTRLTPRQVRAVAALIRRGFRQMNAKQRRDLEDGNLGYSEMPYPMQVAATHMMTAISTYGLGRMQTTQALVGTMMMATAGNDKELEKMDKQQMKEAGSG
jgi:hypothetical protein